MLQNRQQHKCRGFVVLMAVMMCIMHVLCTPAHLSIMHKQQTASFSDIPASPGWRQVPTGEQLKSSMSEGSNADTVPSGSGHATCIRRQPLRHNTLTAAKFSGMEGDLRLVGAGVDGNDPAAGVGILEIFHAGAWGTVCNGDPQVGLDYGDYFGDTTLTVVCFIVASSFVSGRL